MQTASPKKSAEQVTKYADMFSAMGTEARLRIMQLLLSAHPEGLVVGEIQEELDIPNSTLSHHLDKLRNEGLVNVKRESTFLRYKGKHHRPSGTLAVPARRVLHSSLRPSFRLASRGEGTTETNDVREVVKEKYGQATLRD